MGTQEDCEDGGGAYIPYSCGDIQSYLDSPGAAQDLDGITMEYLVSTWWAPRCCGAVVVDEAPETPAPEEEEVVVEEEDEASPEEQATSSSARDRFPSVMATGAVLLLVAVL